MTLYEFIENFQEDDLFNADKRRIMEIAQIAIARFYFEDLYNEDMSEWFSITNANYYELAQEKLKGLKV